MKCALSGISELKKFILFSTVTTILIAGPLCEFGPYLINLPTDGSTVRSSILGPAILGHALPFRKYEEPAEQVPAGPPAGQEWGQLTLLTQ